MDYTTSSEEILDILFDKDDPLLKDVNYYLNENSNECLDEFKSNVFQVIFFANNFYCQFHIK